MPLSAAPATAGPPAIEIRNVSRRFGDHVALRDVSISVPHGGIHALLGPNGAGKTTLMRTWTGLLDPSSGEVRIEGRPLPTLGYRRHRKLFGLVPSGDRSLYLRISGLENLVFFARLYGLARRQAVERAWECLDAVGLREAARKPVGLYSHGMQKRLSVARAMLTRPPVLLVDEATHDLDPEGARRVQDLVAESARNGAAVLWATQRLDEIRGFADRVTVLDRGEVRFSGSVAKLTAQASSCRYVLQLRFAAAGRIDLHEAASRALTSLASVSPVDEGDETHCVVSLHETVVLSDAVGALSAAGIQVLDCREERSAIERAFLNVVGDESS